MSETEGQQVTTQETGRCEKAAHEVTHASWNHRFHESVFQMATAATIDRTAADVAAVKEAVQRILPCLMTPAALELACDRHAVLCERDAAIRERDEARAEVERLKAELEQQPRAAPQPAAPPPGWLTEEERAVLKSHAKSLREQRFALERGGQAIGYSVNPGLLKREADLVDALLARAGSPPVVEGGAA